VVKRHFHGSRNVTEQTAKSVVCNKNVLRYHQHKNANNVDTLLNVTEPTFKRKRHHLTDDIGQCKVILPYTKLVLDNALRQKLLISNVNVLHENATEVDSACRIVKSQEMIHSLAYNKRGESCSFIIGWNHDIHKRYGSINYFFKLNARLFADVNEFRTDYFRQVTPTVNTVGHFIAVENLVFRTRVIDCANIISRCVYVPCKPHEGIIGYLSPVLGLQHD
jgi:hypothetical protein